jgi:hypothetical protein
VVDEASTDERLTPMLDASMVRIVKSKAVTHARTGQRRRCGLDEAEYKDGFGLMVLVWHRLLTRLMQTVSTGVGETRHRASLRCTGVAFGP